MYRAVHEAGLRIPEDVSVVGFDGSELGDYLQPKLTSVAQPVSKMADAIINQLYDMIDGAAAIAARYLRGSCWRRSPSGRSNINRDKKTDEIITKINGGKSG